MSDDKFIQDFEYMLQQRLKALRQEAGYSFAKLEELTGISRSTLQRYETRNSSKIPTSKLEKIADAYNVSPAYLMGWEGKDISYSDFSSFIPLLNELGYKIIYEEKDEMYFLVENEKCSFPITSQQITDLRNTTISYLKFKINEIIST